MHEYICEIKEKIRNHPIKPFESTGDIIDELRLQFAGLFQNLIRNESMITENKTAYDLQQTTDQFKKILNEMVQENELFYKKFEGSVFASNQVVRRIQSKLQMNNFMIYVSNLGELESFLEYIGYYYEESNGEFREYHKDNETTREKLMVSNELFEEYGKIKDIRSKVELEEKIKYERIEWDEFGLNNSIIDEELPFN